MKRVLKLMLEEMKVLANDEDWEIAHKDADDLLLELVGQITDYMGDYESEIVEILEEYKKVGKWYA